MPLPPKTVLPAAGVLATLGVNIGGLNKGGLVLKTLGVLPTLGVLNLCVTPGEGVNLFGGGVLGKR